MSTLQDLQTRAAEIATAYDALSARQGRKLWGPKDRAMGFVTDVGELMEIIMAKEGMRGDVSDVDTKLRHELSDCLWSVLMLAKHYNIDLEQEFLDTMGQLTKRIENATRVKETA